MTRARPRFLSLLGGVLLALASCSGTEFTQTQVFQCPSKAVFTGEAPDGGAPVSPCGNDTCTVSGYVQRRCGTMDCHGAMVQPMRLYGHFGLRYPTESNDSGQIGAATTPLELQANYDAVCTLEPEKMDEAVTDLGQSADQLLLVRKPRGLVSHKGGTIVIQGDDADRCLMGWLTGADPASVAADCQKAIARLQLGAPP